MTEGALTWPQALELVLPGVAVAAVALLLVGIGFWLGRRAPRRSVREIGHALFEVARGRYDVDIDWSETDDLTEIRRGLRDLILHLKDHQQGLARRGAALGDAYERVPGRALVLLDHGLGLRVVGEGFARMVGGRPADFEGKPAGRLFVDDTWNGWLPQLTDAEARQRGVEGRLRLLRAEGEPLLVRALAFELEGPDEGILLQIERWEERQLEEDRRTAELAELRGLLTGLADGLLIVRDGQIAYANTTAEEWLGAQVVGRAVRELLSAEEMLLALDRIGRAGRGERVDSFSCWMLPGEPGHAPRKVEIAPAPLPHEQGEAAVLTIRDQARDAVSPERFRENEARLRAVLETVPDGFLLVTPAGVGGQGPRVSLANQRAAELLELAEPIRPGCTVDQLLLVLAPCFEDPAAAHRFLQSALSSTDAPRQQAFDLPGPEAKSVEVLVHPIRGAERRLVGHVVTLRDVTQHRRIERQLASDAAELGRSRDSLQRSYEELSTAHQELESKTEELDRLNRELTDLDHSRAELLSKVAHDLQTPLVSIRGYTQMVLEGRLGKINDEQRDGLRVAVRNIDRMVQLISNLLALARSEAGRTPELEPVDPRPLLADVFSRHRPAAERQGLTLDQTLEGEDWRLRADPDALDRVLDNLISNAIKFNRPGGEVAVRLRPAADGMALIEVTDSGLGIPEEEQQRVFERFYRGREATRVSGTGIGLATVRELVEAHGGRIELASRLGEGTRVTIRWPMDRSGSSAVAG
jgi:signal transduction histidine kinase